MMRRFLAAFSATLVVVAACGDDDATPSLTPSPSPSTEAATTPSQGTTPIASDGIDLAATAPELVAYGAGLNDFPSDQPGLAVADFSGDGLDDFAAGARFADPGGSQDAGAVYVVFGSSDAPPVKDFAEGDEDVTIYGAGPASSLGFSAAAGDLNGDGAADLILGAPFATVEGAQRGAVYVLFGPLAPGTLDLAQTDADVTLSGITTTGFFGDSLATGDVDGDGVTDLVVGATFGAMDSPEQVGVVYVFLGRDSWTTDLTANDADVALSGADQFDELGDFVVTGDINGDGLADIIATAEAADGPDNARAVGAEVHVLLGREDFERTYGPRDEDIVIYGAAENDTLGFSLAAGDLDGDGTDDLAMSAHLATGNGVLRSGVVYVLYGRDDWPSEIDLLSPPDAVTEIAGESTADLLATSMVIANVAGDGANELALGGSLVDTRGRSDAGSVYVLGGEALGGTVSAGDRNVLLRRWDGSAAAERLGSNISAGDFDGDGVLEIVTIAEGAAGPGESRPGAGRVYILKP